MDNPKEEIKAGEPATDALEIAPVVEDESEVDKILEESIEAVKAGNEPTPVKEEEAKPDVPTEEISKEEIPKKEVPEVPKVEDTSTPPVDVESEEIVEPKPYEFRIPNKGKFESDESFEKRIELLDLVKKRKLAKSEEQREQISGKIDTAKNQLKTINGADRFVNPLNEKLTEKTDPPIETDDEKALEADKERLRQLGGATKEDIQKMVQEDRLKTDVKNTLDSFIGRHTELADEDTREVFFDFVDANYSWQNKGGKDLMTVLELARDSMFKPSESIQERVLKGANVQEKVNAMQFPGGTIAKTEYSPEKRKDLDELIATGMSEEKAVELLSD